MPMSPLLAIGLPRGMPTLSVTAHWVPYLCAVAKGLPKGLCTYLTYRPCQATGLPTMQNQTKELVVI